VHHNFNPLFHLLVAVLIQLHIKSQNVFVAVIISLHFCKQIGNIMCILCNGTLAGKCSVRAYNYVLAQ